MIDPIRSASLCYCVASGFIGKISEGSGRCWSVAVARRMFDWAIAYGICDDPRRRSAKRDRYQCHRQCVGIVGIRRPANQPISTISKPAGAVGRSRSAICLVFGLFRRRTSITIRCVSNSARSAIGHHFGNLSAPFVAHGLFVVDLLAFPHSYATAPPWECHSGECFARPGDIVLPFRLYPPTITSRGIALQLGVIGAMAAMVP